MQRKRFELWHSILGVVVLLAGEAAVLRTLGSVLGETAVLLGASIGGAGIIFVATEVIEEVRNARRMLFLLTAIVFEFILFFGFQYGYLLHFVPGAFQGLSADPLSVLLQSAMVFVFNPLYTPVTVTGKALLLLNTAEALILVFFVLQNIWQFRTRTFTNS